MYGFEWLRIDAVAPGRRRDQAGGGVRDVDAGLTPQPVLERPVLDLAAVAAGGGVKTQVVEVDVRGDLERGAHVDRAVGGAARVVECDPPDVKRAGVVEDRARRDQVVFEGGGRGDRLERRPGRVATLVGAVDQGVAGLVAERVVLGFGVGLRVERRVIGRVGAHAEDRAGVDVHRHEGAGQSLGAQRRLADGLQARIEGQSQVVARLRRLAAELAPRAAQGVHLDPLAPGGAAQVLVIGVLDSRLADDVSRLQGPVGGPAELMRADLADEAEDVRGERTVLVLADVGALDADAGEALPVLEHVEEQAAVEALPEHDRVPGVLRGLADLAADGSLREPQQASQPAQLGPALSL